MGKFIIYDGESCIGSAEIAFSMAVTSSLVNPEKCLLLHVGRKGDGAEQGIVPVNRRVGPSYLPLADEGMDALTRLAASGRLNSRNISDYTLPMISNRLDLATGSELSEDMDCAKKEQIYRNIWRAAAGCYERIYVQGADWRTADSMMAEGDVAVAVLRQNRVVLEQFFSRLQGMETALIRPCMIAISHYDAFSSLSVRNIRRMFGSRIPIVGVPYNTGFSNAWNNSEAAAFIQRNLSSSGRSRQNAPFITALKQLVKYSLALSKSAGSASDEKGA
ncbi:hypothetical protein [Paenibacillus caui]|uniref:hypothetical protein n=1 Tax=Paenibacillus caui TaxID=2873927 RepID=UPI001CA7C867|nr:hypothetical protein [Paenibacillus caui]